MQLTAEQQNILNTNENIVINAVAGSGKTTTLIEYAKTRNNNSKILYLGFNRSVKLEAEQKFAVAGVANV
jgi:F-box protein 18 (helicase)